MNTPIRLAGLVAAIAVVAVLGIVLVSMPQVSAPPKTPIPSAGPTGNATAVVAGYRYTCAITTGGGVKCWGTNALGQLGNGTTIDSITPVDVSGLTSGVTSVALGYQHACALTSLGGVQCWGSNNGGQLGNGTLTDSLAPVDVPGLTSGVTAIDAGGGWVCALTEAEGAKCWGWNAAGQLGNGTTSNTAIPVDVAGLAGGATAIAGGGRHTCALTNAGGVQCVGHNAYGALGDGSTTDSSILVDVSDLDSGVTRSRLATTTPVRSFRQGASSAGAAMPPASSGMGRRPTAASRLTSQASRAASQQLQRPIQVRLSMRSTAAWC